MKKIQTFAVLAFIGFLGFGVSNCSDLIDPGALKGLLGDTGRVHRDTLVRHDTNRGHGDDGDTVAIDSNRHHDGDRGDTVVVDTNRHHDGDRGDTAVVDTNRHRDGDGHDGDGNGRHGDDNGGDTTNVHHHGGHD